MFQCSMIRVCPCAYVYMDTLVYVFYCACQVKNAFNSLSWYTNRDRKRKRKERETERERQKGEGETTCIYIHTSIL